MTRSNALSGVGPAEVLRKHGIEVVHDLPGVGENLMDHVQVGRKYMTSSEWTLNRKAGNAFTQARAGIAYFAGKRNGPLTIGASLAGAYIKTRPDVEAPDLQLHYLPFMPAEAGWGLADYSGFRLGMYQNRPLSRGRMQITSADPHQSPSFLFNHLAEQEDVRTILAGMKIAKQITEAMPKHLNVREVAPGPEGDTDEGLLDYIRTSADTGFHYSGASTTWPSSIPSSASAAHRDCGSSMPR
nr:GMC oxidoreductase [Streptomyces prasinus]